MNKNIKGIIGALVGAIIFSLPWILIYVYANYMLSILAAIIGFGSLTFYKLFGGEVNKKTSTIITVSSLLAITISTFIIIPFWLLLKEGYGFDLKLFRLLYASNGFASGIITDYVISIVFTLLGISGIVKNINNEAYGIVEEGEDILDKTYDEQIEYLKEIFDKYKAYDKKKTVPKSVILSEMKVKNKIVFFNEFEKKGIIVSNFSKVYLDLKAIENPKIGRKNFTKKVIKISSLCILIFALIIFAIALLQPVEEDKIYTYDDISITLPNTFKLYENDEYISYLNSEEGINEVILNAFDLDVSIEEFKKNYNKYIDETFEILSQKETKYDELEGYSLNLRSKTYPDEYYVQYVQFGTNKVYIILFYDNIKDENQTTIFDFQNKTIEYMNSVKYKKS